MNIRTRLTLLFVLLVASIMLLFTVSVYYLYDQFRQQEFENRLKDRGVTTVKLREDVGEVAQADLPQMTDEQVTVYNSQGKILYKQYTKRPLFPISTDFLSKIRSGRQEYLRIGDLEAVGV